MSYEMCIHTVLDKTISIKQYRWSFHVTKECLPNVSLSKVVILKQDIKIQYF